jgi:signal transduction histidine kinase
LSNQIALAIENCLYVEEFKQAQERVFQAEKLASIGGMAEGIAHQITNRLNSFSFSAELLEAKTEQYLKTNDSNPAYAREVKEISQTISRNVNRVYDIVRSILNTAKFQTRAQDFEEFHISEIVNPSVELLKIKHTCNDFPLKVELNDCDGKLYGIKSQLMETIYNILDNAYEAIKARQESQTNGYTGSIVLTMSKATSDSGDVVIEIKDNGIGIKEEDLPGIFSLFFSTKTTGKSGSGIGMYLAYWPSVTPYLIVD